MNKRTTSDDQHPIAGLTATVITGSAPAQGKPPEPTSTRDNTGESS